MATIVNNAMLRVSNLCNNAFIYKISSAMLYASSAYIYKPATITTMELTSAQCLLLSVLHALTNGDIASCCALVAACTNLPELRSTFLKIWLRDDFNFPQQDIQKALSLLSKLVEAGTLQLPGYVAETLYTLAAKYEVTGMSYIYFSQDIEDSLDSRLYRSVTENRAGDIIALVSRGGNINWKSESGDSLLHVAVKSGCVESIAALGYLKAELEDRDSIRRTPLELAILSDNASVVRALLVAGADPLRKISRGDSMLHLAAAGGFNESLKVILEEVPVDTINHFKETALVQAISAGNVMGVDLLLKNGADNNLVPNGGKRLLEMAIQLENIDIINALIENGVSINCVTTSGDTMLHIVARLGNAEIVKVLTKKGGSTDIKNNDGLFPLHVCSDVEAIKALVASGASIDCKSDSGETALHLAVRDKSYAAIATLICLGAGVDIENSKGNTALSIAVSHSKVDVVKLLLAEGANPNTMNNTGVTPLHFAAIAGCVECVEALINIGSTVDAYDNENITPAGKAAINGNLETFQLLVQHGADTMAKNCYNNYIIHEAALKGHKDIVEWLLDHGVSIDIKGNIGHTPLFGASQNGYLDIVILLLNRGAEINALFDLEHADRAITYSTT